jgi:hypothetical protein
MPLAKIQLRPGVSLELTPTLNEGGFSAGQLIRFFAGQVQKYGGWTRVPVINALVGICRGLFGWADLVGTAHLALGTEQRLNVLTGGVLSDITPIVHTTNASPTIATTAASTVVTVTDGSYNPAVGDWVNIVTAISRGGIIVVGYYRVVTSPGGSYTIAVTAPAVSTQASGGVVPVYSTVATSAVVTVVLPAHGLVLGGNYAATVSTVIAGLTIFGNYAVTALVDANTFQITALTLASATTSAGENGGNMQILYLLGSGVATSILLGGWGAGDWGSGDWGLAGVGVVNALVLHTRTWSLDHFGQDLIASPDLGRIYHWSPPVVAPAVVLDASAPIINKVVFSVAQVQIIVACGSEALGVYAPALIRWCDSGDFTAWVATATNQAGSFQLPSGSYITAGLAVGLGALIWTDVGLWSMTYQGLPYVFGFNQIGVGCEALSKKAPASVDSFVIWPSPFGFRRYEGGGVTPMECPVWDYFFNNLDPTQTDQVCSAVNSAFHEISWFFPLLGGGVGYVKWNYLGNVWDYGALTRTAWVDRSPYGGPMATDASGMVYAHETSPDADGMALVSYAQSGYYDLQAGDDMIHVNTIIPDFVASAGTAMQLTILGTDYPGDPPRTYGPYAITPTTRRINVSLRARQVAFRIGSVGLGGFWRLGAVRYSQKATGKRP